MKFNKSTKPKMFFIQHHRRRSNNDSSRLPKCTFDYTQCAWLCVGLHSGTHLKYRYINELIMLLTNSWKIECAVWWERLLDSQLLSGGFKYWYWVWVNSILRNEQTKHLWWINLSYKLSAYPKKIASALRTNKKKFDLNNIQSSIIVWFIKTNTLYKMFRIIAICVLALQVKIERKKK